LAIPAASLDIVQRLGRNMEAGNGCCSVDVRPPPHRAIFGLRLDVCGGALV